MSAPSVRFSLRGSAWVLGALCTLIGCTDPLELNQVSGSALEVMSPQAGAGELKELLLEGRLSLRVTPLDQRLTPLVLTGLSSLPSQLTVELKRALKVSGTVNLAPDPGSDSLPVEAEVWALSDGLEGLLPTIRDEDPFSRELFLFSLSSRVAALATQPLGALEWSRSAYRFEMIPAEYPPFSVSARPSERLTLDLPPLSSLHVSTGTILIDPYTLQPLVGATVVVSQGARRVSEVVKTNGEGRYQLSWWSEALSADPLTFTVRPPPDSRLPVGRFSVDPALESELLSPGEREALRPITLPRLGRLSRILIGVEGDNESIWHGHLTQLWPEERLTGDPVDPAEVDRRGATEPELRVTGLWESQTLLTPQEVGELWVYPREGVLTLRPPVEHPARTTRIELSEIGGDVSSAPLLKQRVTGQVTGDQGEPLEEVEVYVQQRAWPWVDTPHLPLGERWSFSSAEGGLDLALDPGQYALRLTAPPERQLAPRVILTEALELGDVTLDPQLVTLSKGERVTLSVFTPEGLPAAGEVELLCELEPPAQPQQAASILSDAFWGALRSLKRQQPVAVRHLSLARGSLDREGRWSTLLSPQSCPALLELEGADAEVP